MSDESPYNPLAKSNLGDSIATALLKTPTQTLSDPGELVGAGIYAIYFSGDFGPYQPIRDRNSNGKFDQPIYVGKAVPKGGRKGGLGFDSSRGTALRDRLKQHASSVVQTKNLSISDFHFRALTVDDIWIPLGENVLIDRFRPLWNLVIDGFGNKDPGNRRATQYKSPWDVLHPGRAFAEKLADGPLTTQQIIKSIEDYYADVF